MSLRASRFAASADGAHVLDRETGLVWEADPPDHPLVWSEAVAAARRVGSRLPTIAELMQLLTSLRDGHPFSRLWEGIVLWSLSESPFAPPSMARVAAAEPGPRYVMTLREKTATAWSWRVQEARPMEPAEASQERD